MDREKFEAIVRQLEVEAHESPDGYRLKVAGMALLGYAYIFLIMALCAAAVFFMVVKVHKHGYIVLKLIVPLGLLVFMLLKALFVKIEAPQGIQLTRQDAPVLFDEIDRISKQVNGPPVHAVILNGMFNAAIDQVPRLGIFGCYQNYLLLGLPYLQGASTRWFRATLAHEMGHLCGSHGHFGVWLYRVRETWARVMSNLGEDQGFFGMIALGWFCRWYVPMLDAHTFVLRRKLEYEADELSTQVVGADERSLGLMNVHVRGAFLSEKYWPEFYKAADHEPEPPATICRQVGLALQHEVPETEAARWLRQSLKEETGVEDSHPALKDRVLAAVTVAGGTDFINEQDKALEQILSLPDNAAAVYFGDRLPEYEAMIDKLWLDEMAVGWRARYAEVLENRKVLCEIEERAKNEELTLDEQLLQARLTADLGDKDRGMELYRLILAHTPDNKVAHYELGYLLLDAKDDAGVGHVERAMELDNSAGFYGCQVIYGFLKSVDRDEEAKDYLKRAMHHGDTHIEASLERQGIKVWDTYTAHGLDNAVVTQLVALLEPYPEVKELYLVSKVLKHFPEQPLYVVTIVPDVEWYKITSSDHSLNILKKLATEVVLPIDAFLMTPDLAPDNLKNANKGTSACIFKRTK